VLPPGPLVGSHVKCGGEIPPPLKIATWSPCNESWAKHFPGREQSGRNKGGNGADGGSVGFMGKSGGCELHNAVKNQCKKKKTLAGQTLFYNQEKDKGGD